MADRVAAENHRVARGFADFAIQIAYDLCICLRFVIKVPVRVCDFGSHREAPTPEQIVCREVMFE